MTAKDQELCDTVCPLCNQNLPKHSRGKFFHATGHGITSEELARKIHGDPQPICGCGCGSSVRWIGWSDGFAKFLPGHMSKESRESSIKKIKKSLEHNHWSRGLSKKSSAIIERMSTSISNSLKNSYSSGKIKHWAAGKTAADDPRIAAAALKKSVTLGGKNHWHFMNESEVLERVLLSLNNQFIILSKLDDLTERKNNVDYAIQIKCLRCSNVFNSTIYNIIRCERKKCSTCDVANISTHQLELENFVHSLGVQNILRSDRTNPTGYELDIYIPGMSIAIEFNGLYWHSDAVNNDRSYHNRKSIACRQNGITLIHVFEDEWVYKRSIVESMITSKLGLSPKKIGARECRICELSSGESKTFFNDNHIDGDTTGFITYALRNHDTVIAAIKLRKPYSKRWKGFIEIARFATTRGYTVAGGFSKLMKHITKVHHEGIFTYVDTRFGGSGEHCVAAHMELSHTTDVSFWWTDRSQRFNRLHCKATNDASEKENALKRGLFKVWGCANLVYVRK